MMSLISDVVGVGERWEVKIPSPYTCSRTPILIGAVNFTGAYPSVCC